MDFITEWDLTFKLLMLALLLITSGTLIHPSPKASKQTKLHNNPTNWKENCHLHYREELLCCRNAKKQNKQTIRLYDEKTTTVHYRNVRRESRHVAEMRPDFSALLMSALLSIAEMAKLRNLVQSCSARWRTIERCRKTFYPQGNLKSLGMISRGRFVFILDTVCAPF